MKKMPFLLLLSACLFLFSCAGGGNGGGTETGDPGPNTAKYGMISGKTQLDISGQIVLGDAKVWLNDQVNKSKKTGKDGSFTFDDVLPGSYVVYAEWKDQDGLTLVGKSTTIEMGKVVNEKQKPFIYLGEIVKLNTPAYIIGVGKKGMSLKLQGTSFEFKVEENGAFQFGPLPEGTWTIIIRDGQKQIYNGPVTLYAGETFELPSFGF